MMQIHENFKNLLKVISKWYGLAVELYIELWFSDIETAFSSSVAMY